MWRPVPDRRPDVVAGLQDQRFQAPLEQVRGGRQADRARTDHDDGQTVSDGVCDMRASCGPQAPWPRH